MDKETNEDREEKGYDVELSLLDPTVVWHNTTAAEVMNKSLKRAKEAEQLGYKRYWFTENHNTESHASSTPEILAAQIPAVTSHIKVGAANIMLPHQSPLKVAENFRTLEGVYPQRFDLGLSLTTRPDPLTAQALHRTHDVLPESEFEQQLTELLAFFTDTYATRHGKIIAAPQVATTPDIWIQGLTNESFRYASEYGVGLLYEYNGSENIAREVITSYRKFFQPSPFLKEARAILIVSVLCAPSDEEAESLAKVLYSKDDEKKQTEMLSPIHAQRISGSPTTVGNALRRLAEETTADELMIVTSHPSHDVQQKSVELLANEFNLKENLQQRSE